MPAPAVANGLNGLRMNLNQDPAMNMQKKVQLRVSPQINMCEKEDISTNPYQNDN